MSQLIELDCASGHWRGVRLPGRSRGFARVRAAGENHRAVHVGVRAVVRWEGDAATEILAAAQAFKADLILLGTRGRTGVARLVLGSVARNVLHHASSSVLVVRETPREAPKTDV
ncbi:MAG: universal stress protein [Chloroflexota bacterium]|nr:universal stress protein [Chloroflexota bacterium]